MPKSDVATLGLKGEEKGFLSIWHFGLKVRSEIVYQKYHSLSLALLFRLNY